MPHSKEAVILVVVSFLFLILIYSSVAKFEAFARVKTKTYNLGCKNVSPGPDSPAGSASANICCTRIVNYDAAGKVDSDYTVCQKCFYGADGGLLDCRTYTAPGPGGNIAAPNPVANAPPPPPPQPPKNAPPPSTEQTKCPDGSAPDANGKCPPVTQGDSGIKGKEKSKGPTDTGGAGLAVSDEGAPGKILRICYQQHE
jgi:hypothetical protein